MFRPQPQTGGETAKHCEASTRQSIDRINVFDRLTVDCNGFHQKSCYSNVWCSLAEILFDVNWYPIRCQRAFLIRVHTITLFLIAGLPKTRRERMKGGENQWIKMERKVEMGKVDNEAGKRRKGRKRAKDPSG